ncbi:MAG: hypothetical protein ACR2FY_14400 [Pirellulaceae bacterium]
MRFTIVCMCLALAPHGLVCADPPPVSVKLVTKSVIEPVLVGDTLPLKIVIENRSHAALQLKDMRTLSPESVKNGSNHYQPYYDLWLTKPDGKRVLVRSSSATAEGDGDDPLDKRLGLALSFSVPPVGGLAVPIMVAPDSSYIFYEIVLFSTAGLTIDVPGEYRLVATIGTDRGDFRSEEFVFRAHERTGMMEQELTKELLKIPEFYRYELEFWDRLSDVPQYAAALNQRLAGMGGSGNLWRDLKLHDQVGEACQRIQLWTQGNEELSEYVRGRIAFFGFFNEPVNEIRRELVFINLARSCARRNQWQLAADVLAKLPPEAIHSIVQLRKQVAQAVAGKPIASVRLVTKSVVQPVEVGDTLPLKIVVENLSGADLKLNDIRSRTDASRGANQYQPYFDLGMVKQEGKLAGAVSHREWGFGGIRGDIVIPPKSSYSFYEIVFQNYFSLAIEEPGEYHLIASVWTDQGELWSDEFVFRAEKRKGLTGRELAEQLHTLPQDFRDELQFGSRLSNWGRHTDRLKHIVTGNLFRHLQWHDDVGDVMDSITDRNWNEDELSAYVREKITLFVKSTDEVRRELALNNLAQVLIWKKQWKLAALALEALPADSNYSIDWKRKLVAKELSRKEVDGK